MASLSRPVLVIDESQEAMIPVLAELRLLSSARLDSHLLLTVVLAGDQRLLERFRCDELAPLNSRIRVKLALERSPPEELRECLVHALHTAGVPKLMTPELITTLCDHAQGNLRALMNLAGELLALAAQREIPQLDEKLFFDAFAATRPDADESGGAPSMSAEPDSTLPVQLAHQLPVRAESQRWLVTGLWSEQAVGVVGGEPKCAKVLPRVGPGRRRGLRDPVPAPLPRIAPGTGAPVCGRRRPTHRTPAPRGHLRRGWMRLGAAGYPAHHPPRPCVWTCPPIAGACSAQWSS